jgi:hypothetical protein
MGMKLNRQPLAGGVVIYASLGRDDVAPYCDGQLFDGPESGLFAGGELDTIHAHLKLR